MAYLKPPWFVARVFNPLAAATGIGQTLTVKNVRADPNVTIGDTRYVATEVPVEQRTAIIGVYRRGEW